MVVVVNVGVVVVPVDVRTVENVVAVVDVIGRCVVVLLAVKPVVTVL